MAYQFKNSAVIQERRKHSHSDRIHASDKLSKQKKIKKQGTNK